MGVLMVMASHFAQTCSVTWPGFTVSLPVACLVGAILHGNDLRDAGTDRKAGIKTASLLLGGRQAQALFVALHLVPYLVLAASAAARVLPAWMDRAASSLPVPDSPCKKTVVLDGATWAICA